MDALKMICEGCGDPQYSDTTFSDLYDNTSLLLCSDCRDSIYLKLLWSGATKDEQLAYFHRPTEEQLALRVRIAWRRENERYYLRGYEIVECFDWKWSVEDCKRHQHFKEWSEAVSALEFKIGRKFHLNAKEELKECKAGFGCSRPEHFPSREAGESYLQINRDVGIDIYEWFASARNDSTQNYISKNSIRQEKLQKLFEIVNEKEGELKAKLAVLEAEECCPPFVEHDDHYGYVYRITNLITGSQYIGSHKHVQGEHWLDYMGSSSHLKRAIRRFGIENFSKEFICYEEHLTTLQTKERELIRELFVSGIPAYNGGGIPGRLPSGTMTDLEASI